MIDSIHWKSAAARWRRAVATFALALGLAAFSAVDRPASAAPGNNSASGAVQLRSGQIVPGRYIVVFRESVADPGAAAADLARTHGLDLRFVYRAALRGFSAGFSQRAATALARDPRVAFVEPDRTVSLSGHFGAVTPTGIHRAFAPDNPYLTIDGTDDLRIDVDVAIIDTGIDFDHPDLNVVGRVDCSGGGPFKGGSCDDNAGDDGNGHGSHVAGTIGALDDGIGVVGMAPGARLWAVKVLGNNGSGYMSWIVGGIDWVAAHADTIEVANMSLGCECSSGAMDMAITNSVAAGVTFVVSAGNSDRNAKDFSPANHPDVITVSALADFDGLPGGLANSTCRNDQDDTLADFSNWGGTVEIAAPGVCIESTWKGGGYNTISGTSMASPHVAGAAALLAASGMTDPATIRDALIANGNSDWTDDSGDGTTEPLLDVSNGAVFAPFTVAGPDSGGGGTVNAAPAVTIFSPAPGAVFTTGAPIDFAGSAGDDEDGDLTSQIAWTANGADVGTGGTFQATLPDGGYTIVATVTDSGEGGVGAKSASDSVSITVGTPPAAVVSEIAYGGSGGKNGDKHLEVTLTIGDGSGGTLAGASVSIVLTRAEGGEWPGGGLTGEGGSILFSLKNAPAGCYSTTVTDLNGQVPEPLANEYCK